jgi:outer membrane protein
MNKTRTIIILLVILLLSAVGYGIYNYNSRPKMAYISLPDVFNGFQLKKELETKFQQVKSERARIIDSLSFDLKLLSKKIDDAKGKNKDDISEFTLKRDQFLKMKQDFDEDNNALSKKYDQQILDQLNQYVMDYGKAHQYAMILGSDRNGNLMYAAESYNISADIIQFINSKYKGIE